MNVFPTNTHIFAFGGAAYNATRIRWTAVLLTVSDEAQVQWASAVGHCKVSGFSCTNAQA